MSEFSVILSETKCSEESLYNNSKEMFRSPLNMTVRSTSVLLTFGDFSECSVCSVVENAKSKKESILRKYLE